MDSNRSRSALVVAAVAIAALVATVCIFMMRSEVVPAPAAPKAAAVPATPLRDAVPIYDAANASPSSSRRGRPSLSRADTLRVFGSVTDAADGGPVVGAEIVSLPHGAGRLSAEHFIVASTDAGGRYDADVDRARSSNYFVAQASGYTRQMGHTRGEHSSAIVPGEFEIDFVLDAGAGTITGTVVDEASAPVANAVVGGAWLRPVGAPNDDPRAWCSVATTDAQGRFVLDALPEGRSFVFRVAAAGFLPAQSDQVAVGSGTTIVLARSSASVAGTLLSHEGRPVSDVLVGIRPDEDAVLDAAQMSLGTQHATTDAKGAFAFPDLPTGSFIVVAGSFDAACDGVGHLCAEIELEEGDRREVVLRLPQPVVVTGRVYDVATDKGVAGAELSNDGIQQFKSWTRRGPSTAKTRSRADGTYRLEIVPGEGGVGIVKFELPGGWVPNDERREGEFQLINLHPDQPATRDLGVVRGATLRGIVLQSDGIEPAPSVHVVAKSNEMGGHGGSFLARTATAPDGTFAIAVPPGRFLVVDVSGEHSFAFAGVPVPEDGKPEPLTLVLEEYATITGRVAADGKPIEGIEVIVTDRNGFSVGAVRGYSQRTDAEGHYLLGKVMPGEHRIALRMPDSVARNLLVPDRKEVTLAPGEYAVVDFELEWGAVIDGVVSDESGAPIGGATVTLETRSLVNDGSGNIHARSDAEGYYAIGGLHGASKFASIAAFASGYFRESTNIASVADSPVNFMLKANPPIPLFVFAGSPESPLPDYGYRLVNRGGISRTIRTGLAGDTTRVASADGRALLHDVQAGSYRLEVLETVAAPRPPATMDLEYARHLAARRSAVFDFEVVPGVPTAPIEIDLGAGVEVAGRVVTDAGAPVAGAQVALHPQTMLLSAWYASSAFTALTGPSGDFRISSVTPGSHAIAVWRSDLRATRDIDVPAGRPFPPFEIVVPTKGSILVRIADSPEFHPSGEDISYTIAPQGETVAPSDQQALSGTLAFDASERARIDGVPFGTATIVVALPDGRIGMETFSTSGDAPGIPTVTVDLREKVPLSGTILLDGIPWEGAPRLRLGEKAYLRPLGGGAYSTEAFPGPCCLSKVEDSATPLRSFEVPPAVAEFVQDFDIRFANASIVLLAPDGVRLPGGTACVIRVGDDAACEPRSCAGTADGSALVEGIVAGMCRATYRSRDILWIGESEPTAVAAGADNVIEIPVRRSPSAIAVGAWDTSRMQPAINRLAFDASAAVQGRPASVTFILEHAAGEGSIQLVRAELRSPSGTATRVVSAVVAPSAPSFAAGFGSNLPAFDGGCTLSIDVAPLGESPSTGVVYMVAQ